MSDKEPGRGRERSSKKEKETRKEKPENESVEEILRACEIPQNEPVSLEQIDRIFERFPKLIEGAKRNFYWRLRQAFADDFAHGVGGFRSTGGQPIDDIGFVIPFRENGERSKQSPFQERTGKTERETLLGKPVPEERIAGAEVRFVLGGSGLSRSTLVLLFRTEDEHARLYWNEGNGLFANFTSPDDFAFVGLYTASGGAAPKEPLGKSRGETPEPIEYDRVVRVIESLIPFPDADVTESLAVLKELATKEGVTEDEREKLSQSIQTFASFVKPPPKEDNAIAEIGRCLTVPHSYSAYCKNRFGLSMKEEEYGDGISFYHQVNRFGNILIDWTAKQYREYDNAPYPRIYHIDEPLFRSGKPRSKWTEKELADLREHQYLAASGAEY